VANPGDAIQKEHMAGRFYEPDELDIIRRHFRPGGVFLDIGSNVGNHAVFAALVLHAARVVVIEPNPVAIAVLRANAALNRLEAVIDCRWLGVGLGAASAEGFGVRAGPMNLGGGRMVEGVGDLRILAGDEITGGDHVDFLKIDVEGMELDVLAGLAATIARCRPSIFIEVDDHNQAGFDTWVADHGYRIAARHKRYMRNENFMLVPQDRTGD
jgi:FkbM family methyltransferase